MSIRKVVIPFTTNGSGAADTLSEVAAFGEVVAVNIDTGDAASTADFTITANETGVVVFNKTNIASDVQYPVRTPTYDTTGTAITGAYSAPVVAERLRLVVAQGGATKSGVVTVYVDGDLTPIGRGS